MKIDLLLVSTALAIAALVAAHAQPARPSLAGAWTLSADLSDRPAASDDGKGERGGGRRGDGVGRGGGVGRDGGFGRPGGMGRGGDPQAAERLRDALRALTTAADRLTIVETGSMVIIAASDGHTTRLATDGSKIKDEHTNVERRTRWDGAKLVSELSGLGPGKITQTFAVERDSGQLRVTVTMEGRKKDEPPRTLSHVYDKSS